MYTQKDVKNMLGGLVVVGVVIGAAVVGVLVLAGVIVF